MATDPPDAAIEVLLVDDDEDDYLITRDMLARLLHPLPVRAELGVVGGLRALVGADQQDRLRRPGGGHLDLVRLDRAVEGDVVDEVLHLQQSRDRGRRGDRADDQQRH